MSELFPVRTMALEVFRCTDDKRMSEFNCWYDKTCIPAYRQIPGVVSVHRYNPKDGEMLDDWWLYTHAHDLMEYPGYVQCSRYHNISADYSVGDPLAVNFYEIDSDDPIALQIKNISEDQGRAKEGRIWGHFENPPAHPTNLIGVYEHWDIMSAF